MRWCSRGQKIFAMYDSNWVQQFDMDLGKSRGVFYVAGWITPDDQSHYFATLIAAHPVEPLLYVLSYNLRESRLSVFTDDGVKISNVLTTPVIGDSMAVSSAGWLFARKDHGPAAIVSIDTKTGATLHELAVDSGRLIRTILAEHRNDMYLLYYDVIDKKHKVGRVSPSSLSLSLVDTELMFPCDYMICTTCAPSSFNWGLGIVYHDFDLPEQTSCRGVLIRQR
jgi:hypothetical protein